MYIHTLMHIHTHSYTHTLMHTHTHSCIYTQCTSIFSHTAINLCLAVENYFLVKLTGSTGAVATKPEHISLSSTLDVSYAQFQEQVPECFHITAVKELVEGIDAVHCCYPDRDFCGIHLDCVVFTRQSAYFIHVAFHIPAMHCSTHRVTP